jgi:hypothetical protein
MVMESGNTERHVTRDAPNAPLTLGPGKGKRRSGPGVTDPITFIQLTIHLPSRYSTVRKRSTPTGQEIRIHQEKRRPSQVYVE